MLRDIFSTVNDFGPTNVKETNEVRRFTEKAFGNNPRLPYTFPLLLQTINNMIYLNNRGARGSGRGFDIR
jgi:hypothetical protein